RRMWSWPPANTSWSRCGAATSSACRCPTSCANGSRRTSSRSNLSPLQQVMNTEVVDLRKGERFLVVETIEGWFGTTDITLLNVALAGVQVSHAQPLRIGTRARLHFTHRDVTVAIP